MLSTWQMANAVAEVLGEMGEAPEGLLYAGIMTAGATLDQFDRIKAFLVSEGLATEHPGPILRATDKLRQVSAKQRMEVERNVLAENPARTGGSAVPTEAPDW